jgi:hypothetical protein
MYPWDQLGIEPTEDVRAIKRAYGRQLQIHRPDEDQAAFEDLRQAYEYALAQVQPRPETPSFAPLQQLSDGVLERTLPKFRPVEPEHEPQEPGREPDPHSDLPLEPIAQDAENDERQPLEQEQRQEPPPEPLTRTEQADEWEAFEQRQQREQQQRRQPERPFTPPPIELPEPRSEAEVADELFQFAQSHPRDTAAFERYLAEQPELFNIDTKLVVSLVLVARWVADELIPEALQPALIRFFEWDTFTEQRRLGKKFNKLDRLRFLLACADMRRYLDGAPGGRDKDATRRILRKLWKAGPGFGRWRYAWLHPFGDKEVGTALIAAQRRFSEAVVTWVLGPPVRKFWQQIHSPVPNLIQGAVLSTRLLWLSLLGWLLITLGMLPEGLDNGALQIAAIMTAVLSIFPLFILGRWLLRALFYWMGVKLGPPLKRAVGWMDLLSRRWVFAALMLAVTAAAIWWPASWPVLTLFLAMFALLVLTVPNGTALLGMLVTTIGVGVILAAWEPRRTDLYATLWPLSCLYVQWLGYWSHRFWRGRRPASKMTLGGMTIAVGGVFLVIAIIFLNLVIHH